MSRDLEPPRSMSTYRRADGELIGGEFGWVADFEYIEEPDDVAPTEYIREDWILAGRKTVWVPDHVLCPECGDAEVPLPDSYEAGDQVLCSICIFDAGRLEL